MSLYKEIKRRIRDREKTDIFRFIRFWMLSLLACAPLIILWAFGKVTLLVLVLILVFVPPIVAVMVLIIIKKWVRSPAVFMGDEKLAGPSKNSWPEIWKRSDIAKDRGASMKPLLLQMMS